MPLLVVGRIASSASSAVIFLCPVLEYVGKGGGAGGADWGERERVGQKAAVARHQDGQEQVWSA